MQRPARLLRKILLGFQEAEPETQCYNNYKLNCYRVVGWKASSYNSLMHNWNKWQYAKNDFYNLFDYDVTCNRFIHQCHGTVIQGIYYWYRVVSLSGDTYIVQYCSSSPAGGDANIMTAWMTVTRTAKKRGSSSHMSIFDDKQIGQPMFFVLTCSPWSPSTNSIPQSSCRTAGPTTSKTCWPVGEAIGLGPTGRC